MAATLSRRSEFGSRIGWARDLGFMGAATGVGAPLAAIMATGWLCEREVHRFLMLSGALGLAAGVVLGAATPYLLAWRLGQMPRYGFLLIGWAVGVGFGLLVGVVAGEFSLNQAVFRALPGGPGGLIGGLQLGWFWLGVAHRRLRHRSVEGLLVLAAVAAPVLSLGMLHLVHSLVLATAKAM